MLAALMLWNEPNNLSHWNFQLDPEWRRYGRMIRLAARAARECAPGLPVVVGGISPIDPQFIRLLAGQGALDDADAIGIHGFPLDWNHWSIHQWPEKIAEVAAATDKAIWITEAGASSFGAEEVQAFGLDTMARLLAAAPVEQVFWYSLLDLPGTWTATTRHKESEGSAYYRHYYMGLIRADGTPKLAAARFPASFGLCQWFHFEDPRLARAVEWLRRLGVRKLRTGLSWADWFRPGAEAWFDRQMAALAEFEVTLTLCFTPAHLGLEPHYASPPRRAEDFADFCRWTLERYRDCREPASARGLELGVV